MQNNLTIGMLAHVDAGKTTLSEAMLFRGGSLRQLGRVDHQNAFLDTDAMERKRGITIFAKQAVLPLGGLNLTLMDTPGHVDFSAEMERTLQVLDYAILVINASDGVQGHTRTLWQLLKRYHIPTFLFVNKMDLPATNQRLLLAELKNSLHPNCVCFSPQQDAQELAEEIALCDENALSQFLEQGQVDDQTTAALIQRRRLFPCYFGSALRLEGVDQLLEGLQRFLRPPQYSSEFGAKVYKITRDKQNNRLTHLKVTGGTLHVRDLLTGTGSQASANWAEKVSQIRMYSGEKFTPVEEAPAGTVCAVTGLSQTYPGQGLGAQVDSLPPALEPVLAFRVQLPEESDPLVALQQLRQLQEEDPQLEVAWEERMQEISVRLMGEVQLEILQHLLQERFGLAVTFDAGKILYRESILQPVIGMGHFEPLRHYAEVHLLLEPAPRGSGLSFASICSEDVLPRNWQRLVLTHLQEKEHPGVLTGAPITDIKITLLTGRAHNKHTEGGDFRQATYRAVRQGLMQAQNVLLEPWYKFRLEVPESAIGRAMTDLQRMTDDALLPEKSGDYSVLTGSAPVFAMREYATEVAAYTHGLGRLFCSFMGYAPCREQAAAVAEIGYDPQRDTENPADSVFCSHGVGTTVKWNEVQNFMHLDSSAFLPLQKQPDAADYPSQGRQSTKTRQDIFAEDAELQAIYEQTYGPIKRREILPKPQRPQPKEWAVNPAGVPRYEKPDYLLVDGYNIIFAWEDLKQIAQHNMDAARQSLLDILDNYQGFAGREIIVVFDAYKVPGGLGTVERYHNISVVYTKEAETADAYIEKVTYQIGKKHRVTVATSDGTIQIIILGHGGLRIPPQQLRAEIEATNADIKVLVQKNNSRGFTPSIKIPE